MPNKYLNPNCKEPTRQIVCVYSSGLCRCVDASDDQFVGMLFADICMFFGIDIPDYITYALIETCEFKIKFRQFGGHLTIYYNPL